MDVETIDWSVISLKENETLVVRVPSTATQFDCARLGEYLKKTLATDRVMIVNKSVEFGVVQLNEGVV